MTATSDTARENLERDITEALLRLKLARARRERDEVRICEKRLDWLLDRLGAHIQVDEEMSS